MDEQIEGQEVVPETTVEEIPQEEVSASDKPAEGLPEDVSERTRQEFDKLKAHNKELAAKLSLAETETRQASVFDSLRPVPQQPMASLNQQKVGDIYSKLADENGYVDENVLSQALREANERASRAEATATQTRDAFRQLEEREQVRVTHGQFPQLDPNSDEYDTRFFELTRNEMVGQMMRGEQDYLKAAKKVNMIMSPQTESKKPDQKAKIEQINSETRPQGKQYSPDASLVSRVQRGEKGALAELLAATGN